MLVCKQQRGKQDTEIDDGLTSWPKTTLRRRHMLKIGDEKTMIERLLAFDSNTWASLAGAIHVGVVNSESHGLSVLVNLPESLRLCGLSCLVS